MGGSHELGRCDCPCPREIPSNLGSRRGRLPSTWRSERRARRSASCFPVCRMVQPDVGRLSGDFEIEFQLRGVESHSAIILHVHGTGDPIPSLLKLTEANGWLAVDCSCGEFINPKKPSYEGWEGYKGLAGDI